MGTSKVVLVINYYNMNITADDTLTALLLGNKVQAMKDHCKKNVCKITNRHLIFAIGIKNFEAFDALLDVVQESNIQYRLLYFSKSWRIIPHLHSRL